MSRLMPGFVFRFVTDVLEMLHLTGHGIGKNEARWCMNEHLRTMEPRNARWN